MIVRFGYVAMSVNVSNASPSKTMTASQFGKLTDREAAIRKLERIAAENLHNTLRLLRHNRAYDIQLYRFSSRLIPLVGHELVHDWDPFPALQQSLREVGDYVKEHRMRVSFHPEHFTVLSTPKKDVLQKSVEDLHRHVRMLDMMGLDEHAKCNIHIGGSYGNKQSAAKRFIEHFQQLDPHVKRRITLENDDKTFTANETLLVAEQLGIPMVLDIHHHQVNNEGENISDLWLRIARTWSEDPSLPPKIHASSPKSEKDPRGHADYVDTDVLLQFLHEISPHTPALDVMIEAKMKDDALFQIMNDMRDKSEIRIVNQASIEIAT